MKLKSRRELGFFKIYILFLTLLPACDGITVTQTSMETMNVPNSGVQIPKSSLQPSTSPSPTPPPTLVPSPSPNPLPSGNPNDPFDKSHSQYPIDCNYYLNFVKSNSNNAVPIPVSGVRPTPYSQYNCLNTSIPRCARDNGYWAGDWNWCWNDVTESSTNPYRYAVIWFMQTIGDSDDLFHECDNNTTPKPVSIENLVTTPLYLKPDCISLGKWCRAWTGNVLSKTPIVVQYQGTYTSYSVENAFLFLSKNRLKIDFKDETVDKSILRNMTADEQGYLYTQWLINNQNCISDVHFCYECNQDPNHCSVANGCLYYGGWCP